MDLTTPSTIKAQGNARYVGNISRVDIDPVPADEEAVPGSDTFSSALNLWAKKKPDCEKLKHPVDEDPRWDFGQSRFPILRSSSFMSCCRLLWCLFLPLPAYANTEA